MITDDSSVFASLQQVTGAPYTDATFNKDMMDIYLLRRAREKGIRLPTGGPPDEYKFLGAFVETPTAGMNENVVYCDLSSLYPSIIMSLNASPETLIGTADDLNESQYTEDDCVWGWIDTRPVKHISSGEPWQQYTDGTYKMVYHPEKNDVKWTCDEGDGPRHEKVYFLSHDIQQGFLASCVQDMIDLKDRYRGTSLYGAVKRITNSTYGIIGYATENSSFRLFDWRIAEAVTLAGRKIIKGSRDRLLELLHDRGYDDAYACSGDTDATAISLPSVATRDEALRVVGEAVEWLNGEGYDDLMYETFGVEPTDHHTEIEIESFAPRLFIPSKDPPHGTVGRKKRYIQWETWNDDDGECDDISITGLEAIRSDVAPITQDAQQAFAKTLRHDDGAAKEQLYPQLREMAEAIQSGSIELDRVCKRGGIGQDLSEYGSASRRASTFYRGAKYANQYIGDVTIQRGDKPRLVYVTDVRGSEYPSVYDADTAEDGDPVDAVTVPDPSRLPDDFVVDYEKHWVKALKEPMVPLLDTRFGGDSWSDVLYDHEQSGLDQFETPV